MLPASSATAIAAELDPGVQAGAAKLVAHIVADVSASICGRH